LQWLFFKSEIIILFVFCIDNSFYIGDREFYLIDAKRTKSCRHIEMKFSG